MVFGNIQHVSVCHFLGTAVWDCFTYARTHNLASYKCGCHEIDRKRLFVNIIEYTTTTAENRFWEAHRQYLDLHLMLRGTEQIDLNFIENMQQKEYQSADDFLPLSGEKNSSVILSDGSFLLCFPEDGHRTAVAVNEPEAIKKAVFKILI